jgi:hypothetical protein
MWRFLLFAPVVLLSGCTTLLTGPAEYEPVPPPPEPSHLPVSAFDHGCDYYADPESVIELIGDKPDRPGTTSTVYSSFSYWAPSPDSLHCAWDGERDQAVFVTIDPHPNTDGAASIFDCSEDVCVIERDSGSAHFELLIGNFESAKLDEVRALAGTIEERVREAQGQTSSPVK